MKKLLLTLVALSAMTSMFAQNTIVGDWMTVDDKTGDNYSIVRIYQGDDGLYYGKIQKILMGPEDVTCTLCTGADKDAPMLNLVIIRGMHMEKGELRGGKVSSTTARFTSRTANLFCVGRWTNWEHSDAIRLGCPRNDKVPPISGPDGGRDRSGVPAVV